MKTLIVGAGALGGTIGARLLAASLATRNAKSAAEIKAPGLRVTGTRGDLRIRQWPRLILSPTKSKQE